MTKHGGKRPGSGRKPGVRNKTLATVKKAAQKHTVAAISVLARIMEDEEAPMAARVSAANSILDRGYGKPAQEISGPDGGDIPIGGSAINEFLGRISSIAERSGKS